MAAVILFTPKGAASCYGSVCSSGSQRWGLGSLRLTASVFCVPTAYNASGYVFSETAEDSDEDDDDYDPDEDDGSEESS